MLKIAKILCLFLFCSLSAQRTLTFDTLRLGTAKDLLADDYGNIYLYQNKDFSFTKYDSLGNQKAKLMLTLPFRIQSVQNPLNIPSFSENAQELKFFDQNLNQIQTINFRQKFGFIRMAYVEDLQQAWLLDESTKRLIQYNFRDDRVINTFPFNLNFDNLVDLLVFEKKVYFLYKDHLSIYNFKSDKMAEFVLEDARKLRRENDQVLIITQNKIQKIKPQTLETIFKADNSQIVDKNTASYFVIKGNKLYLYPIEKEVEIK
ncbi:hypothetical protein Q73A0000_02170 [Kaistella flava (ex Peng et al. 2021)]|uniref:Uncharacterized protein n=1 Tax=Kaistella flava (ex Peng et al. 2021) TaxID=2038776 RepID=A0A7M2Y574_9FLAO|nr:hypothetical protein Q73A0000_02170 [Kaistella flava (ex Peng et al. 2021)]